MNKKTSVYGIFVNQLGLERAADSMRAAGFTSGDISVLYPHSEGDKDFAHEKATKAPEGATTGGASGAVLGGALGWLAGIGLLAIPGVGPLVAAGPIMAALAGATIGGTVGGVTGALIGLGIPEYEAKRYEGRVKNGGCLISVHCDTGDQVRKAKEVLERAGGEDIGASGEAKGDRESVARAPVPSTLRDRPQPTAEL